MNPFDLNINDNNDILKDEKIGNKTQQQHPALQIVSFWLMQIENSVTINKHSGNTANNNNHKNSGHNQSKWYKFHQQRVIIDAILQVFVIFLSFVFVCFCA